MLILHVSHLYPNDFDQRYGIAVKKAIDHVPSVFQEEAFEHQILVPIPLAFFPLTMLDPEWTCFADLRRKKEDSSNIHYIFSTIFPKSLLRNVTYRNRGRKIVSYIKQKNLKPDILHCHTAFADGLAGYYGKIKLQIPYVLTVRREIDFEKTPLSEYEKRTITETVRHADAVIAPSIHLQNKCLEYTGIEPVLVPNGIDKKTIIDYEAFTKRLELKRSATIITAVGRFDDNKRMDLVLEVAARLKAKGFDIKLNLVGDGPLRETLKFSETSKALGEKAVFHGDLPHADVIAILRDSDIFFLPSRTETFGLVYLEAMAQGLPIVGTAGQGMDGLAKDGEEGFFRKDTAGFIDALEILLRQRALRKEMSKQCLKLARHFTLENTGAKLAEIYTATLKRS